LTNDFAFSNSLKDDINNKLLVFNLTSSEIYGFNNTLDLVFNQFTNLKTYSNVISQMLENLKRLYRQSYLNTLGFTSKVEAFNSNNEYFVAMHFLDNIILDSMFNATSVLMIDDITNSNSLIIDFNIIWFIIYTVITICIYFFIWRPLEITLANDFTKTKLLILLIPTSIIMKRYKILDILKKENLVSMKK
jgi:hypothetical protein